MNKMSGAESAGKWIMMPKIAITKSSALSVTQKDTVTRTIDETTRHKTTTTPHQTNSTSHKGTITSRITTNNRLRAKTVVTMGTMDLDHAHMARGKMATGTIKVLQQVATSVKINSQAPMRLHSCPLQHRMASHE